MPPKKKLKGSAPDWAGEPKLTKTGIALTALKRQITGKAPRVFRDIHALQVAHREMRVADEAVKTEWEKGKVNKKTWQQSDTAHRKRLRAGSPVINQNIS
jgi:hypothetical protein